MPMPTDASKASRYPYKCISMYLFPRFTLIVSCTFSAKEKCISENLCTFADGFRIRAISIRHCGLRNGVRYLFDIRECRSLRMNMNKE